MCEWEPESALSSRRSVSSYGMPRQVLLVCNNCHLSRAPFRRFFSSCMRRGYEGHQLTLALFEQDDQAFFVFDKTFFKQGVSASFLDDNGPIVYAQVPAQEQWHEPHSQHARDAARHGPMHATMLNFLARFMHWKSMAEAYVSAGRKRVQLGEELQGQARMQRRASALALSSLERYHASVAQVLRNVHAEIAQLSQLVSTSLSRAKVPAIVWSILHVALLLWPSCWRRMPWVIRCR